MFSTTQASSSKPNWTSSTGFGRSASVSGTASGSMFGNTSAPSASGSFGAPLQNATSGGLFGNSSTNATTNTGSFGDAAKKSTPNNLFGNSSNTTSSGGFFGGASNSTNSAPFGNSSNAPANTTSTSLFGNSSVNAPSAGAGGLFGNSLSTQGPSSSTNLASGGLFGTSANAPSLNATGGLFGNTASKPATSGSLFGGSSTTGSSGGITASSGGLFGASAGNTTNSGGLFGTSGSSSSGLFGNAAGGGTNGGLFGNSSNAGTNSSNGLPSNDPYNYNKVFSGIQHDISTMPLSITENLFSEQVKENKRTKSHVEVKQAPKDSLIGKLGQTFRILRYATDATSNYNPFSALLGLFTSSNFANSIDKKSMLPTSNTLKSAKRYNKKAYRTSVERGNVGDIKRLIIKSKPSKFHLIDADKVFNAKRRRIVNDFVPSDKLLTTNFSSDDDKDLSDDEALIKPKNKQSTSFQFDGSLKSEKVLAGDNIVENYDQSDDPKMNNGYWCVPKLKELAQLSLEELAAVSNFIIGRDGYGQIAYMYPVDLSGMFLTAEKKGTSVAEELFHNTIRIEKKIVRAYESVPNPPGIGFALNVPATITLVAPRKPGTSVSAHIHLLQSQTGMEFVTYDPISNQWTFKVKHFSVWGLIDDGEETDDNEARKLVDLKRKQDAGEENATLEYSRIYENAKYQLELKKQKISQYTRSVPGGWEYSTVIQESPLLMKQDLVTDEINDQIQLFKSKRADGLSDHVSDITIDSESDRSASPESLVFENPVPEFRDEKNDFEYLKQLVSVLPKDIVMTDIVNENAYEPEIDDDLVFSNIQNKPNLAVSDDWLVQLELANDLNSSLTPYVALTNPEKAVSLQNVDEILFADFNNSVAKNGISTPIKADYSNTSKILEDVVEPHPVELAKIMYQILSSSKVTSRFNRFPKVENNPNLSFLDLLVGTEGDKTEQQALALGSVLFDDQSFESVDQYKEVDATDANLTGHVNNLIQKENFAKWLRVYNEPTIEKLRSQNVSSSLELVFLSLCSGDLQGAVEAAMNSNNSHLSVLLTLTDSSDDAVRSIARNQLDFWEETDSMDLIPTAVVKVYQILTGLFSPVLESLPWNIALALKVFYGDEAPLHELFCGFQSKEDDAILAILQLYRRSKLEGLEETIRSISQFLGSVKLKWLFYKLLSKQSVSENLGNALSVDFGNYLEKVGLWKESIFVYAHHTDDEEVERLIRNVVISNVSNIKVPSKDIDEEEYLTRVLGVSHSLIYEAISIERKAQGDFWGQGEALVEAKLWEEAHSCIIEELGPITVIAKSPELKQKLLLLTASFPENGAVIALWRHGAGLYAEFLQISEQFENDLRVDTNSIESLLINTALLNGNGSYKGQVAVKLISKRVGSIALTHRDTIAGLEEKLFALPLGENEKSYFRVRLQN